MPRWKIRWTIPASLLEQAKPGTPKVLTSKAAIPRFLTSLPGYPPKMLHLFFSNWKFLHESNTEIQNTLQGTKILKKPLLLCFIYTVNTKRYHARAFKKKKEKRAVCQKVSLPASLESISEMRILTFHTFGFGVPTGPSSVISASHATYPGSSRYPEGKTKCFPS